MKGLNKDGHHFAPTEHFLCRQCGGCGGLFVKVSFLESGLIGPKLSHGWGRHVLLLGKTLFSQWLSPTRSINGTSQLLGRPDKMLGSYLQWPSITSRGSGSTPRHFMLQKLEYSTGTDELSDPIPGNG